MFRECYFEYAGVSSQPYNLVLCYVGSAPDSFDSGGKFDLQTDTLPRHYDTFLYGKVYSSQPLNFEVEILNIYDHIPVKQMVQLKNWLFEQDGWKTLKVEDERGDYYLKCILEPGEDIADGTGYKGFRCTVHNASAFWYGEPVSLEYTNAQLMDGAVISTNPHISSYKLLTISTPADCADVNYFPIIELGLDGSGDYVRQRLSDVRILNTDSQSQHSLLCFDTNYLFFAPGGGLRPAEDTWDTLEINTRYLSIYSSHIAQGYLSPVFESNGYPALRFSKGDNELRISDPQLIDSLKITYIPVYRLGAF